MDASVFLFQEEYFRNQLKGLLNDICNVYVLICRSGQRLPNDENKIRDEFSRYFESQTYKVTTTTAKDYYYDPEVWLPNTAGRVDMRFLSLNRYVVQNEFFAIECNRLDGKSHLSKEYIDNGIRRFTDGKYPSLLGCNAMLGFVVCTIDLLQTVGQINSHLEPSEYLKTAGKTVSETVWLESQHSKLHRFVLYHLWMDFSRLVM